MNITEAKTIQIFLSIGESRGIRVADLITRIVQAVAIPRSDLTTARPSDPMGDDSQQIVSKAGASLIS